MKDIHTGRSGFLKRADRNCLWLTAITIVIFSIVSFASPELFLSTANFRSMGFQMAELGFFSLAMMVAFISGGIDLSIIGIANLTGVVVGFLFVAVEKAGLSAYIGWFIALGFVIALLIGLITGFINGFLIARFQIPSMLVTMGTMNLFMGLALILTKSKTIIGFPEAVADLANGSWGIFSIPLILFFLLFVITAIMMYKTRFGFELRFFGTNPVSSRFSGINNNAVVIRTYVFCGIVSAVAGMMMMMRVNSAKAEFGTSYVFTSILCVILGGVSPSGGKGSILGVLLALLSLQFLSSGFNMMHMDSVLKDFFWGALLLLVMTLNFFADKRSLTRKL